MKLYLLDKWGYPVVTFKGRPIVDLIRRLIHTRKITRQRPSCLDPQPSTDGCCFAEAGQQKGSE